ncbi:hypothetical protein GOP47_0027739 [Adiantum capillus-veneris]|nr:hypothetical protein GOP47_0027739 [Adiantum capillus-veneris]
MSMASILALSGEACSNCASLQSFGQDLYQYNLHTSGKRQYSLHKGSAYAHKVSKEQRLPLALHLNSGASGLLSCGLESLLVHPLGVDSRLFLHATTNSNAQGSCDEQPDTVLSTDSSGTSRRPSSSSNSKEDGRRPSHSAGDEGDGNASTSGRQDSGASPSHSDANWWRSWKRPSKHWSWVWNWKTGPALQVHEVGALLLQLSVVIFLMRLLRPGFPLPGMRPPAETHVSTSYVNVAFSDFLHKIHSNEVESVEVDGVHLTFTVGGDNIIGNTSKVSSSVEAYCIHNNSTY